MCSQNKNDNVVDSVDVYRLIVALISCDNDHDDEYENAPPVKFRQI